MNDREEPTPVPRRKPADQELHYHYNREEREASRKVIWTPPQGSFFRRNRALAIILVDVIVVVLLFFIYLFFLRPMAGQIRIDRYRINTQVFALADEILLTVTVTHDREGDRDQEVQPLLTVSAMGRSVSDLAPLPGRERTIALSLPWSLLPSSSELAASITIGDDRREFSLQVPRDQQF